ncbi:MAG: hypothetical protein WBN35_02425 [Acidimicrobiia bacterium]
MMVTLGTDAQERSHTIVAVDAAGAEIGSVTVAATTDGHLRAVQWTAQFKERGWEIEECPLIDLGLTHPTPQRLRCHPQLWPTDAHIYEYMRLVYSYIHKPPAVTRDTSARTSAYGPRTLFNLTARRPT